MKGESGVAVPVMGIEGEVSPIFAAIRETPSLLFLFMILLS
jgi:hypothetical protein